MRIRARLGLAVLVAMAGTATSCTPTSGDLESGRRLTELADALDAEIPAIMQQANTPGLAIVLIREREIAWQKTYGVRVADTAERVGERTIFEAGSMSKPLFAFAALRLVDAGKLDLDRPLDSYLAAPYLPDQPAAAQITARMVLVHTSGLPDTRPRDGAGPLRLQFAPGSGFLYSGEGFRLLQSVVERIVGEDLAAYADREIMRPLGMSRSGYRWRDEFADELAAGHNASGEPRTDRSLYHRPNAANSLYTTAADYARFLVEMLGPPTPVAPLSDELREAMTTVQWRGHRDKSIRSLGWRIDPTSGYVHHSGASHGGFRSFSRFHPELGSGLVIMTNSADGQKVREPILRVIATSAGDAYDNGAITFAQRIIERLRKLYFRLSQPEPVPL
ncbi:MAG: serine hydrolase domain-containing protein [Myxococcota bacterium]